VFDSWSATYWIFGWIISVWCGNWTYTTAKLCCTTLSLWGDSVRKLLLAGIALMVLEGFSIDSVKAQGLCVTVGGPCSSTINQALEYARQLLQLNQETTTAIQEVTAGLALGSTAFNDLTGTIALITKIANDANMLVGNAGYMLGALQTPGGYPIGYGADLMQWHQELTNEANAVGTAMYSAARVINGLQTLSQDTATLATLVGQIMAVVGRQQSLQTLQSSLSQVGQTLQRTQMSSIVNQQALLTQLSAQQAKQYLQVTVHDHDLEGTWVNECAEVTALGGITPASCP
jgi:hypothetical protein